MRKKSLTAVLSFFTVMAFSQARIPVNEPPPGTSNTKPATSPSTTASSELIKYTDPKGRFTIGYPGNWIFNSSPENAVIQITSPSENDNDDFKQNVNLQIESYSSTVDEYVSSNMSEVKKLMKNYREVSSMYFNRNGARAYEVVYKGTYGDMTYQMQIKQLFTIVNGKAYILTYVSKVDERDAFETTANKIFNSFKY